MKDERTLAELARDLEKIRDRAIELAEYEIAAKTRDAMLVAREKCEKDIGLELLRDAQKKDEDK